MNYIELINSFWQKDIEFNFRPNEVALYFYILKAANSTHWKNPIGLSNAKMMAQFGIGKTSFDTAKNRLKKAGLIDFHQGDGRGNVYQYIIKVLKKGTQNDTLSDTLSMTLSDTLSDQKPDTSINIKGKLKHKKDIGHAPPTAKKIFIPPDLKQVREYFVSTIGNPKKNNPWPEDKCFNEASSFLDHYTANGWVQGRGKKIIDWQAACRNWIRNELKGSFKAPVTQQKNQPPAKTPLPEVDKIKNELLYLHDLFLEDETKVTTISIDPVHYDYLKRKGQIEFTEEKKTQIKEEAAAKLNGNSNEKALLNMMKKIGVIEYFKKLKSQKFERVRALSSCGF